MCGGGGFYFYCVLKFRFGRKFNTRARSNRPRIDCSDAGSDPAVGTIPLGPNCRRPCVALQEKPTRLPVVPFLRRCKRSPLRFRGSFSGLPRTGRRVKRFPLTSIKIVELVP